MDFLEKCFSFTGKTKRFPFASWKEGDWKEQRDTGGEIAGTGSIGCAPPFACPPQRLGKGFQKRLRLYFVQLIVLRKKERALWMSCGAQRFGAGGPVFIGAFPSGANQ